MVKISMLLPARGRPKNLKASTASVFDLAAKPDAVEVLVALDNCDPHLVEEMSILKKFDGVSVGLGKRQGYSGMHHYYNALARHAQGQWLFLWNDDIEMATWHWDELLLDCPPFAIQFPRRDITKTTDYTLPVVGRPVYDLIKHISLNAYNDAWVSDISAFAGTSVIRDDIAFVHHRLDDETAHGANDGGKEWERFKSDEQRQLRRADMEKIVGSPAHAGRFHGWNFEIEYHVGVDYINLAAEERRAYGVKLRGRR